MLSRIKGDEYFAFHATFQAEQKSACPRVNCNRIHSRNLDAKLVLFTGGPSVRKVPDVDAEPF